MNGAKIRLILAILTVANSLIRLTIQLLQIRAAQRYLPRRWDSYKDFSNSLVDEKRDLHDPEHPLHMSTRKRTNE